MFKRTCPVARKVVSNFLREPAEQRTYQQTMESCSAEGVDMASQLSSDFLLVQSKLVKYRIARLGDECCYIAKHPFSCFPPTPQLLVHCAALFCVFVGAMWVGRYSVSPLIAPPLTEAEIAAAAAAAAAAVDSLAAEEAPAAEQPEEEKAEA